MTLKITASPTTGWPTKLTVVSDKSKHPAVAAVTESARITVERAGDTQVYDATREVSPTVPAYNDPIKVTDSRGVTWVVQSDDGETAVLVPAS